MEPSRPPLVVAFELSEKRKAIVADALAGASAVVYLTELDEAARAEALRNTGALLTFNTSKELRSGEAALLDGARLIQFMIAGVDFIPLGELPKGVPVATNGGGYAESMAEHALAMALAAAKRLILEHENLKLGQFNQFTRKEAAPNLMAKSSTWFDASLNGLTRGSGSGGSFGDALRTTPKKVFGILRKFARGSHAFGGPQAPEILTPLP
jgi:phosphoglycerate dehydrogenase-like enzyme